MWNREMPSKNDVAPQSHPQSNPSVAARSADERRQVAWVGKSVVFRGDLISSEDMIIDGRVEGSIEVRDHHLTIGPDGNIEADVVAKQVTIFGKVVGSVTGQDRVEIRKGASVEADVTCQMLAMQEGAYFCGKVVMTGRQKSDASKPDAAAVPTARV